MRFLSLALLGLMFAIAPMLAAQAADRPAAGRQGALAAAKQRPAAAARPARTQVSRPQAVRPLASRTQASRPQASRTQAAVQRSAPMRGQLGVARDQRAASSAGGCSPRRGGALCHAPRMSWTQGLPPAANIQANECPDGTMATLARGHDDIVRCMPI